MQIKPSILHMDKMHKLRMVVVQSFNLELTIPKTNLYHLILALKQQKQLDKAIANEEPTAIEQRSWAYFPSVYCVGKKDEFLIFPDSMSNR